MDYEPLKLWQIVNLTEEELSQSAYKFPLRHGESLIIIVKEAENA